ncbi:YigZ family protein [Shewanella sp. A32]|uniref:YigZ family protein n=1 Tax=Shewanella sp. A32 TaxID=3031327 RepID=UPI0023B992EE|nr:YigZ family protein [Shewanella sp. A32]MDF0535360.1 YigZ family protein [Shewanella sp. A32]
MLNSYPIPAADVTFEEEIKHSRFITVLFPCASPEDFKQKVEQLKAAYPAANHYCQAVIWNEPQNAAAMGCSDDGEPSGSAGRPMLNVLQGAGIGEIGAVVIRYFGGVKLGVGGLVRAYSSGVKNALVRLSKVTKIKRVRAVLDCQYPHLADVEHYLTLFEVCITERVFTQHVTLQLEIPVSSQEELQAVLQQISQGQLQLSFSNEPL